MKRIRLLMIVCCGLLAPSLVGRVAAQSTYLDTFTSATYSGSNGTVSWSAAPWIETDGSGGGATGGNLFVVTAGSCPQGSCLNISAVNTADRIYRQADLSAATSATLTYTYCHDSAPGSVVAEISYDGGTNWSSIATYASQSPCPSTQTFPLTQFTGTTRLRFRVAAGGGAILYVDQVQFSFAAGLIATPTMTSTATVTNTPTITRTPTLAGTPTISPTRLTLPLDKTMGMVRCTTCHNAHYQVGGDGMLLRSGNESALCTACHTLADTTTPAAHLDPSAGGLWPGPQYGTLFPPVTDPAKRGSCLNCHQAHGWPDGASPGQDFPTLLVNREENLCFACHDGNPVAKNVLLQFTKSYRHPTTDYRDRHQATEGANAPSYGTANRHAECVDCHNAHVTSADGVPPTAPAASNRIRGVGRVAVINGAAGTIPTYAFRDATDLTAPITEYQVCFKCHSSWTTQPAGQSDTAVQFNTNNRSYHPVEGPGKNLNINPNAFVNGWTADRTMYCTDCHTSEDVTVRGPHGAQYRYLLAQPSVASSAQRTMASTEECFTCHRFNTFANPGASSAEQGYSRFNLPAFDKGHAYHVGDKQYPCYACHGSHGSATQPHLIVTGRNPGINSYTQTAGGGSCSPTCHGTETYSINYAR